MGEKVSDWFDVISSAAQGSVLGLLLFVIFISFMPAVVNSLSKFFADEN